VLGIKPAPYMSSPSPIVGRVVHGSVFGFQANLALTSWTVGTVGIVGTFGLAVWEGGWTRPQAGPFATSRSMQILDVHIRAGCWS